MKRLFPFIVILFFLASCTIQKRVHRPGWHVQWNKKLSVAKTSTEASAKEKMNMEFAIKESNKKLSSIEPKLSNLYINLTEPAEYQAKVEDISNDEVYSSSGGPLEVNVRETVPKDRQFERETSESIKRTYAKSKAVRIIGLILLIVGAVWLTFGVVNIIIGLFAYYYEGIIIQIIAGSVFAVLGLGSLIVGLVMFKDKKVREKKRSE